MRAQSWTAVQFVMHEGAEHSTAKGSAKAFDHNKIIHEIWTLCFEKKIDLWIERVASEFNISDSPSRGEHDIMSELEACWKAPIWSELEIQHDM